MNDRKAFRLGAVTLDPASDEAAGPGGRVHLEPRVMDLAVYLARRPGEVVDREELIAAVWRGYPGADQSLTNAASKLRHALAAAGGNPEQLQTVPKRGYRLDNPVTPVEASPKRLSWRRFAAAGMLFAVAGFLGFLYRPDSGAEAWPRLAVLPFVNLGLAKDTYLAAGLTEEITTRLASIDGLGVISRTSAMQYTAGDKDIPTIAGELGVEYLLEGSVRWQDETDNEPGRIRISTQLIRARDDTHVWTDLYDRALDDIFEVQVEIARDVARQLGNLLAEGVGDDVVRSRPTEDLRAYRAYLRGIELTRRANPTFEEVRRGYAALRRAVDLDPEFAQAWAELSVVLGNRAWDEHDMDSREISAREALDQAIALAPDSPETLTAEGLYYTDAYAPGHGMPKYVDKANEAFRRVLEARPNDVRALVGMGRALRMRGDFARSIEFLEAAVALSPRNVEVLEFARSGHIAMRHWQRAEELLDRLIEFEPDVWIHWSMKMQNRLSATGSVEQGRSVLERAPAGLIPPRVHALLDFYAHDFAAVAARADAWLKRMSPEELGRQHPVFTAYATIAYHRLGETEKAHQLAREYKRYNANWLENDPDNGVALWNLAFAEAFLGNREAALRHGRRAVEVLEGDSYAQGAAKEYLAMLLAYFGERDPALALLEELIDSYYWGFPINKHLLEIHPAWDLLREDPRFQDLLNHAPVEEPWRMDKSPPLRKLITALKAGARIAAR